MSNTLRLAFLGRFAFVLWFGLALISCAPSARPEPEFSVRREFSQAGDLLKIAGEVLNDGDVAICVLGVSAAPSSKVIEGGTVGFSRVKSTPKIPRTDEGVLAYIVPAAGRLLFSSEYQIWPSLEEDIPVEGGFLNAEEVNDQIRAEIKKGEYEVLLMMIVADCDLSNEVIAINALEYAIYDELPQSSTETISLGSVSVKR